MSLTACAINCSLAPTGDRDSSTDAMIAVLREYCAAHPDSDPGSNSLIGALRKARQFDEAISMAR